MSYDTTPTSTELVPIHCEAYADDAELEINYDGLPTVENYDELVEDGLVYAEVRAINRRDASKHRMDIIEPGDPMWDDRFEDLDAGDCWRIDELN